MREGEHLTNFNALRSDRLRLFDALIVSLVFIAICWAVFLMDEYLGFRLKPYGLEPRDLGGLRGIVTMHFLHGDLKHIAQNSLAFLVLNSFLFYFYRTISLRVFLWIFLVAPVILWVIGRPSNHIGASLVLYGEFAFLLLSGIIRRNPILARVALVVTLYYGSLVWYVFPVEPHISWEGHLAGLLVGAALAIALRRQGPPDKVYRFEVEPELDDSDPWWNQGSGTRGQGSGVRQ